MHTLAVLNQKGGVGKTTSSVNLAHAFARQGLSVCAVDLDPQGHMTSALGYNGIARKGLADLMVGDADIESVRLPARPGLDLIPPGARLAEHETTVPGKREAAGKLARILDGCDYDIALVDCPPSGGLLAMNALLAADSILIPVAADHLSQLGAERLLAVIAHIKERLAIHPAHYLALTRFDPRRRLAAQVQSRLADKNGEALLDTVVHESAPLAESCSLGRTIFEFRPRSRGAVDYETLAKECLRRMNSESATYGEAAA